MQMRRGSVFVDGEEVAPQVCDMYISCAVWLEKRGREGGWGVGLGEEYHC